MYRTDEADKIIAEQLQKEEVNLKLKFQNTFETQEKTLYLFIQGVNHANFNEFKDTKFIWNIAAFINIISYDFKIIGQDLLLAKNEWQKRYYARQAILIIYETINDLFDLLGKDFKSLLLDKINNRDIDKNLTSIKAELNSFKSEYFEFLKSMRNNVIAHRNLDSITQITSIMNISWHDTIGMINKFDNILNNLGAVFQQIINLGLENFGKIKEHKQTI